MSTRVGSRSVAMTLAALVLVSVGLGYKGSKRPPGANSEVSKSGPDAEVPCDNPGGCRGTMKLRRNSYQCNTCPRTVAVSDYVRPSEAQ